MIETALFVLLGIALGVLTGLFPGLHLNTVSAALVLFSPALSLNGVLLIVSMNICHVFCDFIPSMFLGAPGEENALSALPGHRLFLQGHGLHAIELSVAGALLGIGLGIALTPLYALLVQQTAGFLVRAIPTVLAASLFLLLLSEKTIGKKKLAALVMLLSGALGIVALRSFENQLFALVSGFFGASTVLFSILEFSPATARQNEKTLDFPTISARHAIAGAAAGSLVSLFPTLSPSQAVLACQQALGQLSTRVFLVVNGAIGASATLFSFVAIVLLNKARTGSAVAVQQLFSLQTTDLGIVLSTALFSAGIGAFLALFLAGRLVHAISRLDYGWLSIGVLLVLALLSVFFGGLIGLWVLGTATATGLLCHNWKIKKSHCMAFLIAPTFFFYMGF